MNMKDDKELGKYFDEKLEELKQEASATTELSRKLMERSVRDTDIVAATKPLVPLLQSGTDLEDILSSIEGTIDAYRKQNHTLRGLYPLTSSSTDVYYSTTSGSFTQIINRSIERGVTINGEAIEEVEHYLEILGLDQSYEALQSAFRRLGLDVKRHGNQSTAELFKTAYSAYKTPVTENISANTSLIPLRECFDEVINVLWQKLPTQDKAKNRRIKIAKILERLTLDSISTEQQEQIVNLSESLLNELSGNKKTEISRLEWRILLTRAAKLLESFLATLDHMKFKGN